MDKLAIDVFLGEIEKQCNYALFSIEKMNSYLLDPIGKDINEFWFYTQSFLTSTANVSKLLWGSKQSVSDSRQSIRNMLNVDDDSAIRIRTLRNHFEHYDERIEKWADSSIRRNFVDSNIGPANMIGGIDDSDYFRNYDNINHILTFKGEKYEVQPVVNELLKLQENLSKLKTH